MPYIFRVRIILNEDQFENMKSDPKYIKDNLMNDIYHQIISQILEKT